LRLAAKTLRSPAHLSLATARALVPVVVAGGLLLGSQLVQAAAPTADFAFSPTVPAVGESVSFSATAADEVDGDAIASVEWDFEDDGSVDDSGPSVQHAYSSSGSRPVRMIVTDSSSEVTEVVKTLRVNAPPSASFTAEPAIVDVGEPVDLDASASSDDLSLPGGAFAWDLDGDGQFDDGTGERISPSFSSAGVETIGLRVTDADGESDTDSTIVTVLPLNTPPAASFAFTPPRPNVNQQVSFDARGSQDDETIPSTGYAWDFDNDGAYDDALGATPSAGFSSAGLKTVGLRVTDADGAQDATTRTFTVNAAPATPAITFTPARPNIGQVVTFNGSATDDQAIPAAGYDWDFDNDGAFDDATGTAPTTTFATAGAKTVRLEVTDADGASSVASTTVTVNAPPTVDFTFTPATPALGQAVTLTASATDDLALPAGAYAWDLNGDNQFTENVTTPTATTTFTGAGVKTVRLRVTDSGGVATTVTKTINTAPKADFGFEPQTPRLNERVTFTSTSSDAETATLTHAWDLDGDGQFDDGTGTTPSWPGYTSLGERVVRLRVTDAGGATSIKERRFPIQAVIPEARFTASPPNPLPNQTVTFSSTSTASTRATITKTEWDFDAISGFERAGTVVTHAFRTAGPHTVTLRVTEDSGGVDIVTQEISVNAPPSAVMQLSPLQPYTGDVVDFVSRSRDPDGFLASEAWDLDGDGQFDDAAGRVASRAFNTAGAHTVRLRVTDGLGAGSVTAVTVNVRRRPAPPPPQPEQLNPRVRILSQPGKRSTRITRLAVRTESGATVRASCKGKGCPKKRASSTRSRGKLLRLKWLERRLPPGTRIMVWVTHKQKIGAYTSILVRRGKVPALNTGCLGPNSRKKVRCAT
jgi:PKD repeat protein